MNRSIRFSVYLLWAAVWLLGASLVWAQGRDVSDDEVNQVSQDLFCPVCDNVPLDVCPTQACADWRELVRQQLSEGKSPQEVHDYFARQYGDGVLANPPRRGFNWLLWLFPVVGLLVGGFFFWRYLRQLQAVGQTTAVATPPPPVATPDQSDYFARVEEELLRKNRGE